MNVIFSKLKKQKINKRPKTVLRQTVAFWSPFSHGSTTCARHYAKAVHERMGLSVALVELDMLHPTLNQFYPVEANCGFKEIMKSDKMDKLNFDSIRQAAVRDGIDVYKNYFSYEDITSFNMDLFERVLGMLQSMYDYVILDCNRNFDNKLSYIGMGIADRILIPIEPNVNDLNLLNQYMRFFEDHLEWSVAKCAAIVNRYSSDHNTYVEIEQILNMEIVGWISYQKDVNKNKKFSSEMQSIVENEVKL